MPSIAQIINENELETNCLLDIKKNNDNFKDFI